MGPLAALTAIIFGSAVAITFGLCGVVVIMLVLRNESAQLGVELRQLPAYCLLFIAMSGISGAAMYSLMKRLPWRQKAQWAMWASVTATAALVWFKQ